MKINELIRSFTIQMSNEENQVFSSVNTRMSLSSFSEREKFIIENLIRKSLLTKLVIDGQTYVVQNV